MKPLTILRTDVKNIFRDPSLIAIFIVPVILIIILRILPPIYEPYFTVMIDYRPLILGTFSLLISALSGFLLAFVMLDEKDQHLFDVFKVTPFTFKRLMLMRIGFMLATGFILCLILIYGSGLLDLSPIQAVLLSLLSALSGPANTLLIISIANNKIEGATYFKGLNMFVMAPLAAIFIVSPLRYLFGILPFFWVFASFMEYQDTGSFIVHLSMGLVSNILYLVLTYLLFLRRTR